MAAVLAGNVLVRNPATGELVVLLAGEALPDWAASLVGGHALGDARPEPETEPGPDPRPDQESEPSPGPKPGPTSARRRK